MLLKRLLAALALSCSTLLAFVPATAQRGMGAMHAPGNAPSRPRAPPSPGPSAPTTARPPPHLRLRTRLERHREDPRHPQRLRLRLLLPHLVARRRHPRLPRRLRPRLHGPPVPRQSQIYLWSKSTGDVQQLTHVTGDINQPAWSPDGKSIAFLFVENATRPAGALDAMKPWPASSAKTASKSSASTPSLGLRQRRLAHPRQPPRLRVRLGAPDSTTSPTSPPTRPAKTTGGSPSSTANPAGWPATIALANRSRSKRSQRQHPIRLQPQHHQAALHGLQIAVPRWSPDGKRVALIGGLMSDQGSTGGDVWVVASNGRASPSTSPPASTARPPGTSGSTTTSVGFVEDRRGHTLLTDWRSPKSKQIVPTIRDLGEVTVSAAAPSRTPSPPPTTASSPSSNRGLHYRARDLAGAAGNPRPRSPTSTTTHKANGPKFESIEWPNEGFHVQGWLTFPKDYDPAKKYPLIVEVHGGPSASAGPGAAPSPLSRLLRLHAQSARLLRSGREVHQANRKDFGYGDLATSSRAWTPSRPNTPSTKTAKALPAGATAAT